jgi:hypothetical protein
MKKDSEEISRGVKHKRAKVNELILKERTKDDQAEQRPQLGHAKEEEFRKAEQNFKSKHSQMEFQPLNWRIL